ncbi:MAG: serine hydrolase [Myxococcota bacterium]
MRSTSILGTAIAAGALLSSSTARANDICAPVPFDRQGFDSVIEQAFEGNPSSTLDDIKGYSVALAKDGQILTVKNGGWAVNGSSSPKPIEMTGATPMNIGSTMKIISMITLLQFFEDDPSATVDEWLDRHIVDYFPQQWYDKVYSPGSPLAVQNVRNVRFRDILSHRSGLPETGILIDDGIDQARLNAQVYEYANGNYSVIGYILPYIVDPGYGATIDGLLVGETPQEGGLFREHTAEYFGDYVQTHMFDPVAVSLGAGISIPEGLWSAHLEPSCNTDQTYARTPYVRDIDWGIVGDMPFAADANGDGVDDLIVWRPSTGQWFARQVDGTTINAGLVYGNEALGDIPLTGDVDGDGSSDYVIWRGSNGDWYAKSSSGVAIASGLEYGVPGDIPLVGNVGGTDAEDFVIWRPSTGQWYAKQSDGTTLFTGIFYGVNGDVPHLGDVNGDGVDELIIWRPSTGQWFAKEVSSGVALVSGMHWGWPADISLVGDVDGNGDDELVIFRPSTGEWYARDSGGDVFFREVYWGQGEVGGGNDPLIPLLGDFDGTVKDKLTVYRPSNGYWSAAGRRYAMGYNTQWDFGPGTPDPFLPEPPGCSAQGGTWMSSVEYAGWAAALSAGQFISPGLLDSLHDPADLSSLLGWGSSPVPSFISSNYGVSSIAWHAGADHRFRAVLVELPDGYYGVGLSNHADFPGDTDSVIVIKDAIVDAWIEAVDLDCES